jgi:hypothetical protein
VSRVDRDEARVLELIAGRNRHVTLRCGYDGNCNITQRIIYRADAIVRRLEADLEDTPRDFSDEDRSRIQGIREALTAADNANQPVLEPSGEAPR